MLVADDIDKLLEVLPDFVCYPLKKHIEYKSLIEVVMDLGRRPEARFPDGPYYLSSKLVSWQDLDYSIRRIGNFSTDNRAGIERTLHRISSIRNRKGTIVGLTCRVGRAIFGTISIIRDLLEKHDSILLLGKPGVGKTTAIREITRVLADEMEKRVVIIDTSNEIAGDGDIPHPAIGRARRMQVVRPELQHQVMIEAIENHMPEVIIIDEISTELEALAARTIAERGVQLVGTAHGNYLENIIKNPVLSDLVGGIQYVTLGDEEAKRRGSQKSIIERKSLPAFQVAVEIHERDNWIVHDKVEEKVDQILQGAQRFIQRRKFNEKGEILIDCEYSNIANFYPFTQNNHNLKLKHSKYSNSLKKDYDISIKSSLNATEWISTHSIGLSSHNYNYSKKVLIYSYSVNIKNLNAAIELMQIPLQITRDIINANAILAIRSSVRQNSKLRQIAKTKQITIYTIHNSSVSNIIRAFKQILDLDQVHQFQWEYVYKTKNFQELIALSETQRAIETIVLLKKQSVELLSQSPSVRKLQYQLIESYKLRSRSFGEEPERMLRIYPY